MPLHESAEIIETLSKNMREALSCNNLQLAYQINNKIDEIIQYHTSIPADPIKKSEVEK
jgi:hypothetical protein